MSVSCCLNMRTTNWTFWERHSLISLSHYFSIYHHLYTLPPSLWVSSTAASRLCSFTTHLTYHLHGNGPAIFFLIAIRCMCDLSIKWCPGSRFLHRQTKGRRMEDGEGLSSSSLSLSNFCFILHSRICFVASHNHTQILYKHCLTAQCHVGISSIF